MRDTTSGRFASASAGWQPRCITSRRAKDVAQACRFDETISAQRYNAFRLAIVVAALVSIFMLSVWLLTRMAVALPELLRRHAQGAIEFARSVLPGDDGRQFSEGIGIVVVL